MRSDDVIYIDLESYKGFYNDIGKDDVYKVSAKSGVLPGLYKFVEDESGDTCESCALCGVKDQCQTCFECYNLSAKKIEDEENPVENPSENKNAQKAWEAELKEIESQITSLEEVIDDLTAAMIPGYWLSYTETTLPAGSDKYACLHWNEFVSLDEEQKILYYDDGGIQAFKYG